MSTLNVISNYAANVAHRNLETNNSAATNSVAKLSSGTRVMSGKDDAAALAIGSRLQGEVTALRQANINAGQAVSMLQIADGAMARIGDIADRMKSLAVQAGSGQLSSTERGFLNDEFSQLRDEMERIAQNTNFNGVNLIADEVSVVHGTNEAGDALTAEITFADIENVQDGFSMSIAHGDGTDPASTVTFTFVEELPDGYTQDAADETVYVEIGEGLDQTLGNLAGAITTAGLTAADDEGVVTVTGGDPDAGAELSVVASTLTFDYKVGTGTTANDRISISVSGLDQGSINASLREAIGDDALAFADYSLTTIENADAASDAMSAVIDRIAATRADLGASMNRLEFASANLSTVMENTEAARSQLMDLDIAAEISNFTSKQILVQAGTSMLAQANQLPQNLMRLFN